MAEASQTGTRIEETARLPDLVEAAIRREIPTAEMDVILDNIGLPYSVINWMHSASGVIGAADADLLVSLKRCASAATRFCSQVLAHLDYLDEVIETREGSFALSRKAGGME